MEYLKRMQRVAWRIEQEPFELSHPGYYIFGVFPAMAELTAPRRSFHTQRAISQDALRLALVTDARVAGRFLAKVVKREGNPFPDRISLGRATNNDIVIEHPSVSKIHAHFVGEELGSPMGPKVLQLQDAGSTNGTGINGRAVIQGPPVELHAGDSLKFGEIQAELLDAAGLHFLLRTKFQPL